MDVAFIVVGGTRLLPKAQQTAVHLRNVSSLPASLLQPGAPLAECRWKWRRLRCLPASVCMLRRPPDWRSVLRIKAWHPCMPR